MLLHPRPLGRSKILALNAMAFVLWWSDSSDDWTEPNSTLALLRRVVSHGPRARQSEDHREEG